MLHTFRNCIVVVLMALVISCSAADQNDLSTGKEPPIVIGHRGYAGVAPENTLAGISAALGAGVRYIEIDVQMTQDGRVVLMHDRTVDRTTDGTGRVNDLDSGYIDGLDAGSWFSDAFAGERVPELGEVLRLVRDFGATLVIEVKHPSAGTDPADQIVRIIRETATQEQVVVVSFDGKWLEKLREMAPGIITGDLWLRPRLMMKNTGSQIASINWVSLRMDPTAVSRLHRRGYEVWAWTVDNPRVARRLASRGVDAIITNNIVMIQQAIDASSGTED